MTTALAPVPATIDNDTTDALFGELHDHAAAAVDAIVDTRALTFRPRVFESRPTDFVLDAKSPEVVTIAMRERAHRQIAENIDIPWTYYQRMMQGQPDLLAVNVNRWFQAEPLKRTLRMLKPVLNDADRELAAGAPLLLRAMRSDSYKALDNFDAIKALLPVAQEAGMQVRSYALTDDNLTVKFVSQDSTTIDALRAHYAQLHGMTIDQVSHHARGANGEDVSWVNEVVSRGMVFGNSEIGVGALYLNALEEICRCLNHMISTVSRTIHAGAKKDEGWITSGTRRLEDAAVFLKLADAFRNGASLDAAAERAVKIDKAATTLLPLDVPLFQFVENVGMKYDLNETEVEIVKEETSRELNFYGYDRFAGRPTQFAISQAITAAAKRMDTNDRRLELETIGWQVVDSPVERLLKAGHTKTTKRNARNN